MCWSTIKTIMNKVLVIGRQNKKIALIGDEAQIQILEAVRPASPPLPAAKPLSGSNKYAWHKKREHFPNMPKRQSCPDCGAQARRVSKAQHGANYRCRCKRQFSVLYR